ncbi:maltose ABC transporter permease MalF [Scleromatobacter humisilvae]|uniref:Maltose/maltodextrin transport system permease protein n=1 Tax=Scleromatobacter humisilvae TaxID=2897159 RepID=A0A9X1YL96_9BURK|nr:maltose ABC transporter permease MalF [Scleromatobacter humisilvae]MCK9686452.1 maltose ABC transporter permease MalF [Scleromatobacter humisilvae]
MNAAMNSFDWKRAVGAGVAAIVALGGLWLVFAIHAAGQPMLALGALALIAAGLYVYVSRAALAWRYLFPGVVGMLLFVAFPLVYTMWIGFTNYSSTHLLSQARVRAYLLEQTVPDEEHSLEFTLHPDGDGLRLVLAPYEAATGAQRFVSAPLKLKGDKAETATMSALPADQALAPALSTRDVLAHRDALMALKLAMPDQRVLSYAGVHEFGPSAAVWRANPDESLTRLDDNKTYAPNNTEGFYIAADGDRLQPGYKVAVGFANYARMLADQEFRGPFVSIFVWTVVFAALSVALSLGVGCTLAVLLNWEALRFRTLYRTLLFLPYAVPGFISILVFKGLFNQNFGEINGILAAVFGIKPAWFADPLLARTMMVVVNTWLGYPYFLVLCTGLLKAIPVDLYEASAIAGAKPLTNFFKITAPLIVKPLSPLIISAFAFNFNNFVLVSLLTNGRPDFLNTKIPAGTTDILVSYTYRIAFLDSGQNFGLAAAISTVIFFLVALLSFANLRVAARNARKG